MVPFLKKPWHALAIALTLEAIILILGQGDFVASDPLWYAETAHRIAVHGADVFASHDKHPFVMRIGLTLPLAMLYRVFSVSTLVTNLPSILSALGITAIAYAAAPTPRAKLLALALCLLSSPLLHDGTILNVDLPSAALMAASVLCLSRRERPRGATWLAFGMAAWFAAFLVKEVALWCAFVWLYAIAADVRTGGWRAAGRRYAPALAVGIVLGGAYLVACRMLWSDPLARFHGIDDLTYEHAWALPGQGASAWLHRLTWETPWLAIRLFGAMLIPAALAPWLVRGPERIWWIATAMFGALYWFGSTSLSAYAPLPISPRMILPLLPPILVLAAVAGDAALDRLGASRWRLGAVIVVGLAIVVPGLRAAGAVAARRTPETAAFAALRDQLARTEAPVVLVCAEPRCTEIATFYFGFDPPPRLTVVFANDFARAPLPGGARVYALVNQPRSLGAHRTDPALDRTAAIDALGLPAIAGDREIHLYDAGDGVRLWRGLH